MERFQIDTGRDDALLDDLNDELEGMMHDDADESMQPLGGNTRVGDASTLLQMDNMKGQALEDEELLENVGIGEVQQEPEKYFNDDIREKLRAYREKKHTEMIENQYKSVESNLG